MTAETTKQTATAQAEARLAMQVHVTGEGRPLALVGGGLTGMLSWAPIQQRLASRRRVARLQPISVQFGLEDRPLPPGYSIELESDALGAGLDGLGWTGPVDLVAWSHGALISLDFALDHPERVRTLALVEPPVVWLLEDTGRFDDTSRRQSEALRALHRRTTGEVTEDQLAEFLVQAGLCPPGVSPRDLPQWPSWVQHRRSLRSGDAPWAHVDRAERVRRFPRPVLLVKGVGSPIVFHRIVDTLAETLPHGEVVALPGGHAAHLVSTDEFLARLAAFHDAAR